MSEDLGADLGDTGHGAEGEAVRLQSVRVHADEQGERGASGMATDEDLARVATMFRDVLHRPREGRGGIVDVGGVLDLRAQSVVRRDHRDPGLSEALADLGAIFRSQVFRSFLESAAIEINTSRKPFRPDGYGQVKFAAFLLVRRLGDDVILVADVLDHLGLDRRSRGGGEAEQQDEEAHQAMMDWTILPWTSVRRKSRPELRKVNSS